MNTVEAGPDPVRVLELRSVWGTGGGPDKTILLGASQADRARHAVTVCYIRDARDPAFGITDRAKALVPDYVEVIERHSFDIGVWSQLRRLVQERRIQLVHSHDYKTDILALSLAWAERIVPLSTAHGWSGESKKDQLYYDLNKRTLRRFPRVIAVSGPVRRELLRYGADEDRVVVVSNGIEPGEFTRNPEEAATARHLLRAGPGDVMIGAVGRLETVKCFDLLIEAFKRVRQQLPTARLVIVGEGPRRAALERLIAECGLNAVCSLLGHRADVKTLYQGFDLFVQSSRSEGSPNAVLEAMALEVPIVATDVGGTADLVAQGVHGLLVPFGDAAALVDAMRSSITDVAASQARVKRARERVERELSFRRRNEILGRIYDDLAGRRTVAEFRQQVSH